MDLTCETLVCAYRRSLSAIAGPLLRPIVEEFAKLIKLPVDEFMGLFDIGFTTHRVFLVPAPTPPISKINQSRINQGIFAMGGVIMAGIGGAVGAARERALFERAQKEGYPVPLESVVGNELDNIPYWVLGSTKMVVSEDKVSMFSSKRVLNIALEGDCHFKGEAKNMAFAMTLEGRVSGGSPPDLYKTICPLFGFQDSMVTRG